MLKLYPCAVLPDTRVITLEEGVCWWGLQTFWLAQPIWPQSPSSSQQSASLDGLCTCSPFLSVAGQAWTSILLHDLKDKMLKYHILVALVQNTAARVALQRSLKTNVTVMHNCLLRRRQSVFKPSLIFRNVLPLEYPRFFSPVYRKQPQSFKGQECGRVLPQPRNNNENYCHKPRHATEQHSIRTTFQNLKGKHRMHFKDWKLKFCRCPLTMCTIRFLYSATIIFHLNLSSFW